MVGTNDAQVLVMSVLADGPLHGYAINTAIEALTGQRLGPGSLYGALRRLESKGLVESVEGRGRRQPVRLTPQGRAVLGDEARSMARVSEHVFEAEVPDEASYLDRVAATDAARSYKQVMGNLLDVQPGQTVLDLGCGPGIDLPALASAVGPSGKAIGIDANQDMAEEAHRRTRKLTSVEVRTGDLHDLPLGESEADGARIDRALQHVLDPGRVLAEIRRVLRPGGRLVMAEPDWDSLTIDYPDIETARGYTHHVTDRIVRNGTIGRQLTRLATGAGYTVLEAVPVTSVFRDSHAADQILGLQRNTRRAVAAGYLSADAGEEWLHHLATEPFFAALTLHVVLAETPGR